LSAGILWQFSDSWLKCLRTFPARDTREVLPCGCLALALGPPQISIHPSIAVRATGRMGNIEIESAELKVGHQVVWGNQRDARNRIAWDNNLVTQSH